MSKILIDEATVKLALEALEGIHPGNMTPMAEEYWNKAITALREALAQQPAQKEQGRAHYEDGDVFERIAAMKKQPAQQEPVAWMTKDGEIYKHDCWPEHDARPLVFGDTSPPAQQEPCDMGSLCIGCNPRNIDGSCPGQKLNGACDCYVNGFNDGMKELEQPAQQEPPWWPAVENILDEYGLQAIDFVADFKAAQRKPLTDEEIENIWRRVDASDFVDCVQPFARALEAAHGIKEDA